MPQPRFLANYADKVPRRGTVLYLTVLSTALIVSLLGLAAIATMRIERRQETSIDDRLIARSNARSAIELGLRNMNQIANWRTTYSNGVETAPLALGSSSAGTVSFLLIDSDGSLTDADTDLRLKGIGRVGNTVQVSSVQVQPGGVGILALRTVLHSLGNITLLRTPTVHAIGGPLSSNAAITERDRGTIVGDVEVNSISSRITVTGKKTVPAPPKPLPPITVFDKYLLLATTIPYSSLPKGELTAPLLSATSNPYGATNPYGIYYIDVPNKLSLLIMAKRIKGTLLVRLRGQSDLDLKELVHWESYPGFATLIVKTEDAGNQVKFKIPTGTISEAAVGVNLNPPGTPYNDQTDATLDDAYPSRLAGLVHIAGGVGAIILEGENNFGTILCDGPVSTGSSVSSGTTVKITLDPLLYDNPPYGYESGDSGFEVTPGSWVWDSTP